MSVTVAPTFGGHDADSNISQWLHSQNLIPLLLSFLSNEHSQSTQTASGDFIKALITISANASQNEQSCIGPNDLTRQLVSQECIERLISDMLKGGNPLTVGVGIIIEVIRKNNSDYDPDIGTGVDSPPSSRDPIYLGTLLRLFASHVPDFMKLIMSHGLTKEGARRELKVAFGGTIEPLGFDRFKTCELMAELLHCSNMGLLNEKGGERYVKERDRERERLKQERLQHMIGDRLSDLHGGAEGVVVEKAPLQVQNGGVEMSDDGITEEDFEDVLVSEMLEDVRSDVYMGFSDEPTSAADVRGRSKKEDEEDIFVDELLSPPTAAKETDAGNVVAPVVVTSIPADEIPRLDKTPTDIRAEEADKAAAAEKPRETVSLADVNMGEASAVSSPETTRPEAQPSQASGETSAQQEVPKAPTPPTSAGAGEDVEAREGGKSLAEDLKADAESQPENPFGITAERLDAELPPLPVEQEEIKTIITPPQDEEENLLDLNSTPDTTIAEGDVSIRSMGSFESSYTEYHAMVEPDLDGRPVVGDYLKMMFVEHQVVPTILVWLVPSGPRSCVLTW
jgi:SIT4-associating protein SAP185/190